MAQETPGRWATFRAERQGQLVRPFWTRAGIWWLQLVFAVASLAAGLGMVVSGDSLAMAIFWMCLAVFAFASVPRAYRQNRADRVSVERSG